MRKFRLCDDRERLDHGVSRNDERDHHGIQRQAQANAACGTGQAEGVPSRERHVCLHRECVPSGAFKGERVKEQVYEPDWQTNARASYTVRVARRSGGAGAVRHPPLIQPPPLGYKPRVTGPEIVESYTRQLHTVVAYLTRRGPEGDICEGRKCPIRGKSFAIAH